MAGLKEIAILFRTATRLWRPSNCAADATSLFALFFFFINREHLVLLSIRWFSRYFYNLHPHKRIYPLTMNNTSYAEESRIKYRKYKGHIWILQKDDRNGQKCHLTVRHTQKTPILIGLLNTVYFEVISTRQLFFGEIPQNRIIWSLDDLIFGTTLDLIHTYGRLVWYPKIDSENNIMHKRNHSKIPL